MRMSSVAKEIIKWLLKIVESSKIVIFGKVAYFN